MLLCLLLLLAFSGLARMGHEFPGELKRCHRDADGDEETVVCCQNCVYCQSCDLCENCDKVGCHLQGCQYCFLCAYCRPGDKCEKDCRAQITPTWSDVPYVRDWPKLSEGKWGNQCR